MIMQTLPTPRYAAARHVLTSPSISAVTARHVQDGHIDWNGILAEAATMSGGQRFLVEMAVRLWSGEALPSSYELAGELDPFNVARVLQAADLVDGSQDLAAAA
jgi:hypothetical protein